MEANSTGGQGSSRAVAPSHDDDDDDDDDDDEFYCKYVDKIIYLCTWRVTFSPHYTLHLSL